MDMRFDRRTVVAGLGCVLASSVFSNAAIAAGGSVYIVRGPNGEFFKINQGQLRKMEVGKEQCKAKCDVVVAGGRRVPVPTGKAQKYKLSSAQASGLQAHLKKSGNPTELVGDIVPELGLAASNTTTVSVGGTTSIILNVEGSSLK